MPDVNQLKKFHNADSFRDGDIVTFVDAGQIKNVDFSKEQDESKIQEVLQLVVSINGEDSKPWSINKTSIDNLGKVWGSKTEKWVGRQAVVEHVSMMVFGKKQSVVSLEPFTSTKPKEIDPTDIHPSDIKPEGKNGEMTPEEEKSWGEMTPEEEKAWDEELNQTSEEG